jgi:hypothetical protein
VSYLLQNCILFLDGQSEVSFLGCAELCRLLLELLLPLLDGADLLLAEAFQRLDELLVGTFKLENIKLLITFNILYKFRLGKYKFKIL